MHATSFLKWLVTPKLRHINEMLADEKLEFESDLRLANWCDPLDRPSHIYDVAVNYMVDPTEAYIYWREMSGQQIQR